MVKSTTSTEARTASWVGMEPLDNRAWGFFGDSVSRAWEIDPQVVEAHLEKTTTESKTASCVPHWPSRDPIGERGDVNLYGFVGNDGVNSWDYLGLDFINQALNGGLPAQDRKKKLDSILQKIGLKLVKANFLENNTFTPCHCDPTLCEIIAQALDEVAKASSSFGEFTQWLHTEDGAQDISVDVQKKFKRATGCDHKGREKMSLLWAECHGFRDDVSANGSDNVKHFAAVLFYGTPGALWDINKNESQRKKAIKEGNLGLAAEHVAESVGDRRTASARKRLRDAHRKNGANPTMNIDKAWWDSVKGTMGDVWRNTFCEPN